MQTTLKRALGDLVLAGIVTAAAVVLFIGARDLPPPRFEPLGSAALPRILGGLMIFFAALIALRALWQIRHLRPAEAGETGGGAAHPWRAVATFGALVAFVGALNIARAPFVPCATVFLAVTGFALSGWKPRALVVYGGIGLVLSFGLSQVLTNFLYVTFR